jgi:hypothetical protein
MVSRREHGNNGQAGGMLGHPRSHLREVPRLQRNENRVTRYGGAPVTTGMSSLMT